MNVAMNSSPLPKGAVKRKRARPYHSPLRAEQMQGTRPRLVEKIAELLSTEGLTELSVAEVARRAQVSVRTAYRYFPTKESLIDAFNQWYATDHFKIDWPESAEAFPDMVRRLFEMHEKNEALVRAQRNTLAGKEIRRRRKGQQRRVIEDLLRPLTAHLDPELARGVLALVNLLGSSSTYLDLRDDWQLAPTEAARAAAWAVGVLLAELRRGPQQPAE